MGSEARGTDLSKRCINGDTPVVDDLEEISKHYPYVGRYAAAPGKNQGLGPTVAAGDKRGLGMVGLIRPRLTAHIH